MKILKPHPEFYKQYKDKILQRSGTLGTVVGYYIENDGSAILVAQTEINDLYRHFDYFIRRFNVKMQDYHGDPSKDFFLVGEIDIKRSFVKR